MMKKEIADQLDVSACLTEVVEEWVTNTKQVTFEVLIRALESHTVANRELARRISQDIEVCKLLQVPDSDPGSPCIHIPNCSVYCYPYLQKMKNGGINCSATYSKSMCLRV